MHWLAWRIGPTAVCAALLLACGDDVKEAAPDTGGGESSTGSGTSTPPSTSETAPTSGSESTTMSSDSATSQGEASNTESQSGTDTTTGPITATATTTTDGSTTMSVDPTDTTGGSTTMSDTTSGSSSGGSSSTGMECLEPDRSEPNDAEGQSDPSPDVECANPQQQSIEGALHDGADADWFQFNEIWNEVTCGGAGFDPRLAVDIDAAVSVCAFFSCNAGTSNLANCNGATPTSSPVDGWPGCCAAGDVAIHFDCAGTGDESAQVRVAVYDGADACTPYTFTYDLSII